MLNRKPFTRLLLKSEFAKNAFTLTIGTSIAQVFPMLFYPFFGRLFTPAEFGLFAIIMSITSIIAVLSTGKYESCILIADTKQDAANIIGLTLLLSFSVLLIAFIILQLFSNHISIWFDSPSLKNWLFVIPLNAFMIIIFACYNEWCVRNKYFISLSGNKIINSGSNNLSKLFLGIIKLSSNGLIMGDLIGRTITAFVSVFRALSKDKEVFTQISIIKIKMLAKRYSKFPMYFLPGQLINTVGGQLAVILIGIYYSSVEVGYYAMTSAVLSVPTNIISMAIKDIFRQRANEDYQKNGDCRPIFKKMLRLLSIIVIIGLVLVIFILPTLFQIILGEKWRISGEYAQILAPMIALSFISNSLSGVLVIVEKVKIDTLFQIYYISISFISLFMGFIIFHNVKMTLLCYAIGLSSAYIIEIFLSFKLAKK